MKNIITVCTAVMGMTFSLAANAQDAAKIEAPDAVLVSYYEALKNGDKKSAKKLTASFDMLTDDYISKYTEKYSEGAKAGKLTIKLVPKSMKVIEDCAVVTFEDGDKDRPDYDPAYLLKQDDHWKVFLKLTKWDRSEFKLSDEQKTRFAELEAWFDKEKDRLYGR